MLSIHDFTLILHKKSRETHGFFCGIKTKLFFASYRFGKFNELWAVHDGA